MKRFIDSILAGQFDVETMKGEIIGSLKADLLPSLREAVLVNITNVFDWFTSHPDQDETLAFKKLAPLAKMPFPTMWCEWEQADVDSELRTGYAGILCLEDPENPRFIRAFNFTASSAHPRAICCVTGDIELSEDFSVQSITPWISKPMREHFERDDAPGAPEHDHIANEFYSGVFCIPLCAFSFFNCSNVQVRYARPTKSEKRKERKSGVAHKPMGFIEIHKNMVRTKHDYEAGSGETAIVPYIVRGHFKRYDKDHKLFGRVDEKHAADCIVQDGKQ